MFPTSPSDRFVWALRESLILFGIFVFWAAIAVAVTIAVVLLETVLELTVGASAQPFRELFRLTSHLQDVVFPLSMMTGGLYVLVRTGTLLIDHYVRKFE